MPFGIFGRNRSAQQTQEEPQAPARSMGARLGAFGRNFTAPSEDGRTFADRMAIAAAHTSGNHGEAVAMRRAIAEQTAARRQAQAEAEFQQQLAQRRMGSMFPGQGSATPGIAGPMPSTGPMQIDRAQFPTGTLSEPNADTIVVSDTINRRGPSMRPPMSEQDDLQMQLELARDRGDWSRFNALTERLQTSRQAATQATQQGEAAMAAQLLRIPQTDRAEVVRRFLMERGIDAADTMLDDFLDDASLRARMAGGNPGAAVEEGIRTQGTFDEYRRPEMVDQGNQRVMVSTSGTNPGSVLGRFAVSADPNAVLGAQTQRRGQDVQAQIAREQRASQQMIAQINANTSLTNSQRSAAVAREQIASAERIAVLTGRTLAEGESHGGYIDEGEF